VACSYPTRIHPHSAEYKRINLARYLLNAALVLGVTWEYRGYASTWSCTLVEDARAGVIARVEVGFVVDNRNLEQEHEGVGDSRDCLDGVPVEETWGEEGEKEQIPWEHHHRHQTYNLEVTPCLAVFSLSTWLALEMVPRAWVLVLSLA